MEYPLQIIGSKRPIIMQPAAIISVARIVSCCRYEGTGIGMSIDAWPGSAWAFRYQLFAAEIPFDQIMPHLFCLRPLTKISWNLKERRFRRKNVSAARQGRNTYRLTPFSLDGPFNAGLSKPVPTSRTNPCD